jgi:tetratricopeptide (TPR) repeat protein
LGAYAAWLSGKENPMPWIQQALARSLTSARTHLLLAAILARRGASNQALLELRLALEQAADQAPTAARLAVQLTRDPGELARAVPDGTRGGYAFLCLAKALPRDEVPARLDLLRRALSRDPRLHAARVTLLEHLLSGLEGRQDGAMCAGEARAGCEREALEHVQRFAEQRPDTQAPVVLQARLLHTQGRTSEAVELLSRRCPALDPRTECLRQWLQSALTIKDHDREKAAERALELDGCSDHRRCANTLTVIGDLLRNAGEPVRALAFYERAAREEPSPARWHRVGQGARALGDHARAAQALELADRGRRDDAARREIDQERLGALKEGVEGSRGPRTGTRAPPSASDRAPASSTPTTRVPSRTSPRGLSPSVIDLAK